MTEESNEPWRYHVDEAIRNSCSNRSRSSRSSSIRSSSDDDDEDDSIDDLDSLRNIIRHGIDSGMDALSEESKIRLQLESDDPSLVDIKIGQYGYHPTDRDWERDGRAIGKNTHLRELEVLGMTVERYHSELFRGVASNRSIRRLGFCDCDLVDREMLRTWVPFLKKNPSLERLRIDRCGLERDGLRSLASVLRVFDSLREFELSRCGIEEEDLQELMEALSMHHFLSLRELVLRANPISKGGCDSLAFLLANPMSKLSVLCLVNCNMDDEQAEVLAKGLAASHSLNCLHTDGWRAIFEALQIASCSLETLNLCGCRIDDESALSLSKALSSNNSLKSIDISENRGIGFQGWLALFESLQSLNLDSLDLARNRLCDEAVVHLASLLHGSCTIKTLSLQGNPAITLKAWRAFATVLLSPDSELETLDIQNNVRKVADVFVSSLANNYCNLKELLADSLDLCSSTFCRVLCNDLSIMDTYCSNHTLQRLCEYDQLWLPGDVKSYLDLNRDHGISQAARIKIIMSHFQEGYDAQPFLDMKLELVPHAIAWMVRGGIEGNIDERFYEFLRRECATFIGNGYSRACSSSNRATYCPLFPCTRHLHQNRPRFNLSSFKGHARL